MDKFSIDSFYPYYPLLSHYHVIHFEASLQHLCRRWTGGAPRQTDPIDGPMEVVAIEKARGAQEINYG